MSFRLVQWAYSQPVADPLTKSLLVFYCSHAQQDGYSWHPVSSIYEITAISKRKITLSAMALEESGLITVNARLLPNGSYTSNLIRVCADQPILPEQSQHVIERMTPCIICDFDKTPYIAVKLDKVRYGARFPTVKIWKS